MNRASTVRQPAAHPGEPHRIRGRGLPPPAHVRPEAPVAVNENPQPATAAEALERRGGLSLRELSMDGLLQTVADLSKSVMPGNPGTWVLLRVRDRPSTVVSTGSLA